jgi:hypothetical protein
MNDDPSNSGHNPPDMPKLISQIFGLSLLLTFGMLISSKLLSGDSLMLLAIGKESLTLSLAATIVFLMVYTLWETQRRQAPSLTRTEEEVFELPEPAHQVFDHLCEKMLEKGWRLLKADAEQGRLRFRTRITSDSWGEYIHLHVQQLDEGHTRITVRSEPLLKTKISDYLKAQEHVRWIKSLMRAEA